MHEGNEHYVDLTKERIFAIPLEKIKPRNINAYAITDIERLADSIQRSGLLQPIIVEMKISGEFSLIAGERRYTAVKYLHDKFVSEGDNVKASLFDSISAVVLPPLSANTEKRIYRDTNDYTRQMNTFQRIALFNPENINMSDDYWKEEYVRKVFGEKKVISWKAGFITVKGTQRERCKLIHAMILEQNPDTDISEKTIRNYLAFYDRCSEELRIATLMGKISIREAIIISWNNKDEQRDAVESIGKEIFKDYLEEGKERSGIEKRKNERKNPGTDRILRKYQNKLLKLKNDFENDLSRISGDDGLTIEEKAKIEKIKNLIDVMNQIGF